MRKQQLQNNEWVYLSLTRDLKAELLFVIEMLVGGPLPVPGFSWTRSKTQQPQGFSLGQPAS